MSTLILELSDVQLQKLERLAQQRGTSMDAMIRAVLEALTAQSETPDHYDITQDSLYNIKAHETGAPADLSQHADHYLYGAQKP
jgi:hypothetical protein